MEIPNGDMWDNCDIVIYKPRKRAFVEHEETVTIELIGDNVIKSNFRIVLPTWVEYEEIKDRYFNKFRKEMK